MPLKPEYKVTLLGAGGVGKSALTLRIISGQFTPQYNPTIEDYYRHDTNVDGVGHCIVEILDTAGTEQFASMRQLYISNGEAFALIYSVDNRDSFEEVQELYEQLLETKKAKDLTVVLVGNKCDLRLQRAVETQEGVSVAKTLMSNCTFIETSAKDGTNVEEFFDALVSAVDRKARGLTDKDTMRKSFRLGTMMGGGGKSRLRASSDPNIHKSNSIDYPHRVVARPGSSLSNRKCTIL